MKVNINKYNTGGPFHRATFIPAAMLPEDSVGATTTGDSDKKSGKGLVEDDLLEKLVGNGLTSDVNMLVKELSKQDMNSILSPGGTNKVLQLIGKVNEIKNNKEMWNEAITQSKANGSFSEVAVSSEGAVFYKNSEGTIGATDINSYTKNPKKYGGLLTVSDLLLERQRNNGLAFDTKIFNIATASIGMEKVVDYVSTLVKNIGMDTREFTDTYSKQQLLEKQKQTLSQLTGKVPSNSEIQALHSLQEAFDTPGDYTEIYTKIATGEGKFGTAMNYIWNSMDPRFKNKVIVTAAVNGVENPKQFMLEMMVANNASTMTTKISPIKENSLTDVDNTDTTKSLTNYQMFHKDKLRNPDMSFVFNDPKLQVLFRGAVGGVGPVITPKGETVTMTTLGNVLSTGIEQVLKVGEIYFGNKKVPREEINSIIYDGADAAKVYMPVNNLGGPDYESFKEFKEVYSIYEANKNQLTTQDIKELFDSHGFKVDVEETIENGKIEKVLKENEYVKPFYILYGYTNDATSLIGKDNENFVTKLSRDEKKAIVPQLEQIWTVGTGKNKVNMTPSKFWNIEDYYKGMIAIPYRKEHAAIVDGQVGQGPREKVSTILDVQRNIRHSSQPATGTTRAIQLTN